MIATLILPLLAQSAQPPVPGWNCDDPQVQAEMNNMGGILDSLPHTSLATVLVRATAAGTSATTVPAVASSTTTASPPSS